VLLRWVNPGARPVKAVKPVKALKAGALPRLFSPKGRLHRPKGSRVSQAKGSRVKQKLAEAALIKGLPEAAGGIPNPQHRQKSAGTGQKGRKALPAVNALRES
jgi:hypothetical protein